MDAVHTAFTQYLRAAWRQRWIGVIVAWLVCGAGWAVVAIIPNQFQSSARLYVDTDAVLTPLLRGIAADSAAATQLEVLQRTLLSRPNLETLISKTGLDLTLNGAFGRERLLTRLAADIKINSQTRYLFTITYRNKSPQLAHDVVQTLLTIFVESATGGSRTDMENARRFLERQIQSYEQQLRAAEQRRADFRARYADVLPADDTPNVPAMESARAQAQEVAGKLQDALAARDALRQEVENTPPLLVVEAGAQLSGRTKLQDAEEQLRQLLLKDTDQHPDVIAQRKLIESLRKAPPDVPAAAADGVIAGPKRSAPNPVYDQLKVKLIEAEADVTSLQRQSDDAARYLEKLEKIQREQPGLIAEYQNMDRDYNVLRRNYEDLLSRLQSANIAQAADTEADKVKLQVIDPPEIPRLPVAPRRLLLVTGVLFAGLGAGIGMTVILGQLDRSFATIDELRALGLPVLGGISAPGLQPLRRRLVAAVRVGAALAVLISIYGGLVIHVLRSGAQA